MTNKLMWRAREASREHKFHANPAFQSRPSRVHYEELSTIIDSILIQNLALTFALSNGFDPDFPEGLTKVTKTI